MNREYAIVRPYPGTLGAVVQEFVEGLGLTLAEGVHPSEGTPDDRCAQWMARSGAFLFVVPFHMHRGGQREVLDGIGVIQSLPTDFPLDQRVLFMPVRDFSWSASFQRRFDELKSARPEIMPHLVTAHEEELGSPILRAKLRRKVDDAGLVGRTGDRRSIAPTSTRSSGRWTFPAEIFSGAGRDQSSSLPPPITSSRFRVDESAPESRGNRGSGEMSRFDIETPGSLSAATNGKKS